MALEYFEIEGGISIFAIAMLRRSSTFMEFREVVYW